MDPASSSSTRDKQNEYVVTENGLNILSSNTNKSDDLLNSEKIQESTSFTDDYEATESSGRLRRWLDSFKRAEEGGNGDERDDDSSKKSTHLKKTMQTRHVVMMSLGTGIGTGLLVANAKGLALSGPAPLVLGYGLVSFVTYFMIQAAGELAVTYPTLPGNFNVYFGTFISKPFGFATVWLATVQWLTVLPLELITISLTIKYWNDKIDGDVFVVIFYVFLLFIHFFGVRAYGEAEFIFNSCKIMMIIGFIILSIVINCGGAGNDGYIGAKYWHDPGAFTSDDNTSRFKGVCFILITGFFSYGGTELFVLSVNEQANPRKSTPQAAKHSIYRILIIYLLTMVLIGFNVPYNSEYLMGAGGSATHASPYVLAASIHGVKVVPHFINAVILIAVTSVANSSLFAAPRLMVSLAQQGFAPKCMTYVDREGRPLVALGICALFGVIGFSASSSKEEQVFTWLAAIAGLSELFTWSAFFISHIRFRQAMRLHGNSLDELGFKAVTGVYGSIYGLCFNILVFIAQFWVALAPIGNGGKCDANAFFESYLAFPIWLFFYFAYAVWKKDFTILNPLESIDIDHYRTIYDPELKRQEDEEQRQKWKHASFFKKIVYFFC